MPPTPLHTCAPTPPSLLRSNNLSDLRHNAPPFTLVPPHLPPSLCSNNLSDLPDDFDQLRYLRTLRMKYNQIKRIPAVITRLPQV